MRLTERRKEKEEKETGAQELVHHEAAPDLGGRRPHILVLCGLRRPDHRNKTGFSLAEQCGRQNGAGHEFKATRHPRIEGKLCQPECCLLGPTFGTTEEPSDNESIEISVTELKTTPLCTACAHWG